MCWKLSLLSDTDWAVRQPPYKSSCFVTPCLETWAGLQQQERHSLVDAHLGSHSRRNNDFGAFQTAILVSILTQIEWLRRARSYVCWETTCGSVTTRWDNSCSREDVITERAVCCLTGAESETCCCGSECFLRFLYVKCRLPLQLHENDDLNVLGKLPLAQGYLGHASSSCGSNNNNSSNTSGLIPWQNTLNISKKTDFLKCTVTTWKYLWKCYLPLSIF